MPEPCQFHRWRQRRGAVEGEPRRPISGLQPTWTLASTSAWRSTRSTLHPSKVYLHRTYLFIRFGYLSDQNKLTCKELFITTRLSEKSRYFGFYLLICIRLLRVVWQSIQYYFYQAWEVGSQFVDLGDGGVDWAAGRGDLYGKRKFGRGGKWSKNGWAANCSYIFLSVAGLVENYYYLWDKEYEIHIFNVLGLAAYVLKMITDKLTVWSWI